MQEFDPANDDGNGVPIVLPPLRRSRSGDGAASGPCAGAPGNCLYTVNGGSYSEFEGGFDPAQSLEMARPVRFNGPTFGTGAVTKNKGKGTAAIAVDFDVTGLVRLTGVGVEPVLMRVPRPGVVQLEVRATGRKASILSRKHQVTVTGTIDFSATAEPEHTVNRTITLQRSKSHQRQSPSSRVVSASMQDQSDRPRETDEPPTGELARLDRLGDWDASRGRIGIPSRRPRTAARRHRGGEQL